MFSCTMISENVVITRDNEKFLNRLKETTWKGKERKGKTHQK